MISEQAENDLEPNPWRGLRSSGCIVLCIMMGNYRNTTTTRVTPARDEGAGTLIEKKERAGCYTYCEAVSRRAEVENTLIARLKMEEYLEYMGKLGLRNENIKKPQFVFCRFFYTQSQAGLLHFKTTFIFIVCDCAEHETGKNVTQKKGRVLFCFSLLPFFLSSALLISASVLFT